jgi:hypothetical protein
MEIQVTTTARHKFNDINTESAEDAGRARHAKAIAVSEVSGTE